ncbi:MFS transporter [Glutamicibacter sp.]|uniref:MFS transporter n=1 Tax=Glutamicibacter sp. TaxID=1931995 RepID=UPI002B48EF3B|nr:MFS transporter [Glutamicibacter sp.]HJX79361.1 MFS transporter [Glutamicibacter sp.]
MNTVKASTVTPQEFIDSGGLKARHWLVFGVIALVLMADGMDITIVSHVFPSLVKEWGATGTQITFIVTVSFIGMGLGAIIGGRMADRFGRKILTVLSLILLGVTTIAMATAPNMEMFIFWRIVSSLGLGGVMPVIMTLLADLVPSANRGQLVAIVSAGIGLGTTFGAFLAGAVIPDSGWRTLMTICGIIPLALIIPFLALVPESPAWLAARGSMGRARRALEKLVPGSLPSTVQLVAPAVAQKNKGAFKTILSRRFVAVTGLIWAYAFIGLGVQMTIVQYLPTLLQAPVPGLTTAQSSLVVGLYGAGSMVGNILLGMLLRKYSRFGVVGTFLVLSIGSLVIIGSNPSMEFPLLVLMMSLTGLVLPTILGGTQNIFATIEYPARVRATGVGSASLAGRVGSVAGGITGGTLLGAGLGFSGFFLVLALPVAVMVGVVGAMSATKRHHSAIGISDSAGENPQVRSDSSADHTVPQ